MSFRVVKLQAIFLVAVLLSVAGVAKAADQIIGLAPDDPKAEGFQLIVYSEELRQDGFQPVALNFTSMGTTFTRQRNFRVLLRPRTSFQTRMDYQYAVDVTVPEGVRSHRVPVELPSYYHWESMAVVVEENGRRIGRNATHTSIPPGAQGFGQKISIGIIVPKDALKSSGDWQKLPDMRAITTVLGEDALPSDGDAARLNGKQAANFIKQHDSGWVRCRVQEEDELRPTWLSYSQLDIMIAPYPVLQRLESERPAVSAAIQEWVATGGQLWTYDLPTDGVASQSWLAAKPVRNAITYVEDATKNMGLDEANMRSVPVYQSYGSQFYSNDYVDDPNRKRADYFKDLEKAQSPMVEKLDSGRMRDLLSVFPYGLGRVALIDDPDPFPGSFQLWLSLRQIGRTWHDRQGVNISDGSQSYWRWLIGTVGRPPVSAFVFLNAVFVLVMGPILYFVLRRRGKLYLLYFLAPTLALLVTSGLFLYAFLSDGLSNRAKVRQITWVDARHPASQPTAGAQADSENQSPSTYPTVDQLRHTYYTVLDAKSGLHFPLDSMVLPVSNFELIRGYRYVSANHEFSGDHLIEQLPDSRRYYGSFLGTRTQTQFLETRSSFQPLPILIEDDGEQPKVSNRSESALASVAYHDDKGGYWVAYDVAPGATVTTERAANNIFNTLLQNRIEPQASEVPSPYSNLFSADDRSELESIVASLNRHSRSRAFIAITKVPEESFALPDCDREGCSRIIAGVLP